MEGQRGLICHRNEKTNDREIMTTNRTYRLGHLLFLCGLLALPLMFWAQSGFELPMQDGSAQLHMHAVEMERHLALDSLEALARQQVDPEETWSLISGFSNREVPTRKTRFSWIPFIPSKTDTLLTEVDKNLRKRKRRGEFYAFHAFWMGKAWQHYDLGTISRVLYLDYAVDPETGANRNPMPSWSSSGLHAAATEKGTAVDLGLALHGIGPTIVFLSDKEAQAKLIENVIALLQDPAHQGSGVNLDFNACHYDRETAEAFDAFALKLHLQMQAVNQDWQLSVTLPSQTPNHFEGFASLGLFVHRFIVLGYDHHDRRGFTGPVSPWETKDKWRRTCILRDLKYYRHIGVPPSKMVLVLPWYGVSWLADNTRPGARPVNDSMLVRPVSFYQARFAKTAKRDPASHSAYLILHASDEEGKSIPGRWWHHWWEDRSALTRKYTYAQRLGLGGVGIWALGYDKGQGTRPEVIPLLLAASKILPEPPAPVPTKPDSGDKDSMDYTSFSAPVETRLEPGWPLSFIQGYNSKSLGQFFWVQVDSFAPLLPNTDEEYLFLSPDVALPLPPKPFKMALWGLVFLGCFLELAFILPLFRYRHRMLVFVERPLLGLLQIPLIVGGALGLVHVFSEGLPWYIMGLGMTLALVVAVFWQRKMTDVK